MLLFRIGTPRHERMLRCQSEVACFWCFHVCLKTFHLLILCGHVPFAFHHKLATEEESISFRVIQMLYDYDSEILFIHCHLLVYRLLVEHLVLASLDLKKSYYQISKTHLKKFI